MCISKICRNTGNAVSTQNKLKNSGPGDFLAVSGWDNTLPLPRTQIQPLARALRSCEPCGTAEKKKKSGAHFIVKWQKILTCTKSHIHKVEQELWTGMTNVNHFWLPWGYVKDRALHGRRSNWLNFQERLAYWKVDTTQIQINMTTQGPMVESNLKAYFYRELLNWNRIKAELPVLAENYYSVVSNWNQDELLGVPWTPFTLQRKKMCFHFP